MLRKVQGLQVQVSANFDSTDWIDDAVDNLHRSQFPYLLITGVNQEKTRIDSSMGEISRESFLELIRSGRFEQMVLDHFERNPQP